MSVSGSFRYQFDCSNNVTSSTISTYLPITNISSSITIGTISVTSSANTYTVAIPYSYTTITTTSGVNFNVSTTVFNYYNNTSGTSTVRNLKILDLGNIPLSSAGSQFKNLTTLTSFTSGTQSTVTSLNSSFMSCTNLTQVIFDASFNTTNVTNTTNTFNGCNKLQSLNLSNWNTKKVTTMASMFQNDASLNSISFGVNFDASSCTTMASMFSGCSSMTAIDLGYCTTPSVTTMNSMFNNCSSLTSVNISNFTTNNVTNMDSMFKLCGKMQSLNLINWNTKKVTTMANMFYYDFSLNSITFGGNFDASSCTTMANMFYNCSSLTAIDLSNCTTPLVTSMSAMFGGCNSLTSLDISKFTTNNVTNMYAVFYQCNKLPSLNLSNWNTKKATTMGSMFHEDFSLNSITFSANFDASSCTTMASMFYGCSSLTAIDLSYCTTPSVTSMGSMFYNCSSLSSLNITNFATNNVTNMYAMFGGCSSLSSLNISNFNTNNVPNMAGMFGGCSSLTSLNVSNFTTPTVSDTQYMFYGCSNLSSLNISNFTTSNVTNMDSMFYGCSKLPSLSLANWNTTNVTNMTNMFNTTPLLTTIGDVYTNWNVTNVGTNHANFALNSGLKVMPNFVDSPTITSAATASVSENISTSTTVYTVIATDPDANTTFIYSICGGDDSALFTMDASNGIVRFNDSPNFDAPTDANGDNVYNIIVAVSDGANIATKELAISVTNANDAASITGTSVGSITESDIIQSVSGKLTVTDEDAGQSSFVAQTDASGNNGYGSFTIDANGNWTYTMSTAHNEFVAGQTYTDSITVVSVDGSATQDIIVTIRGTNNIPTIGGQNTGSIIQSTEAQSVSGALTIFDADAGESSFVPQTGVSGNNSYGLFTIGTNGAWTYTMNNAHTEFAAGIAYTDRITVSSVDGTATQDIIVTMTGINNAPSITNSTNTSRVTTAVGTTDAVYTVTSTDVDANTTFTYSISGGVDASLCNIGSTTGAVTFKDNPTVGIYYITVKVADENSAYDTKEITIIVTSESAANHTALTQAVQTITQNSVVVGDVAVSDLTTTASVQVPNKSTLTVASGDYSGILTGNGSVAVTGDVNFTAANLSNYTGEFTVSYGTLNIAASAGNMITLTNDSKLQISNTDAAIISTHMYASSNTIIENTNADQEVTISGRLYKPTTNIDFVGKLRVVGHILGQNPTDTTDLPNSDIYVGNSNLGANVTYTSAGTYTYNGETLIEAGSTLTFENGGVNVINSDFVVNGSLVLDYTGTNLTYNTVKSLTLNGFLIINISSTLEVGTYHTLLTSCSSYATIASGASMTVNYTGSNSSSLDVTVENNEYNIQVIARNKTTPTSNVCFPAKTPIMTNQGPVNIEEIDPAVHTIRNKKIVAITKTVAHDKNLVRIAKHALGHLYPEKTTFMSQNHKVFCQGQMVKAKHLVDNCNITLVPYNGQVLYNVLLAEHEKMQVNNLIVETLHPEHKVAKLYRFLQNVDAAHHGKLIALFNQKDREQRLRR